MENKSIIVCLFEENVVRLWNMYNIFSTTKTTKTTKSQKYSVNVLLENNLFASICYYIKFKVNVNYVKTNTNPLLTVLFSILLISLDEIKKETYQSPYGTGKYFA